MKNMNELERYNETIFEEIKHIDEFSNEYWEARELQIALEYTQWRRFEDVITKAKLSCINSNYQISDHFANIGKMIEVAKEAKRTVIDYRLSRYACYLIVQNGAWQLITEKCLEKDFVKKGI